MRLFTKIFFIGMLLFGLAFSVSGYFLLHYSLESSMAREVDFALKQYQYDKFTVQSAMLTYSDITIVFSIEDSFLPGEKQVYTIKPIVPFTGNFSDSQGAVEGQENFGEQWYLEEKDAVENGDGAEDRSYTSYYFMEQQTPYQGQTFPEGQFDFEAGITHHGWSDSLLQSLAEEISSPVAFFSEDKTPIYSEIEEVDRAFLEGLSEDAHVYQFRDTPGGGSVLVGSLLVCTEISSAGNPDEIMGETTDSTEVAAWDTAESAEYREWDGIGAVTEERLIYFVTEWDISKTMKQQDTMQQYFMRCYVAAMAAGMVLLSVLSAFLTGPLKRMSKAARRMAEGDYRERFARAGKDEIGALAVSFNQMADAVEEKIGELSKAAREKEDFVANFAHELKTPLTSIIGYADTMYQKELPREEIRKASWHIWNEGMRLEALSLKLMDLTILGRQEFPLQEMWAEALLQDAVEGLTPLLEEKKIELRLQADGAFVRADYDLLKTLLINLVDNAVKAGSSRIEIAGKRKEEKYWICVGDNGCGMEEEELSRITEAFYMVDKARSRKQHGAGLGLALADRIARIHGGELTFESREGEGTKVSFSLVCEKDVEGSLEKDGENRFE